MRERDADSARSRWWETPGSLCASLLRLDGQVGAVVNVEKHVADSATGSGELARHLGRLAQQRGFGMGNEVVDYAEAVPRFEPVKSGFTREAGLFRW